MFVCYKLIKNEFIKYDQLEFDKDYQDNPYTKDKLVDIQYSTKQLLDNIKQLKKYSTMPKANINNYLSKLDLDELYYIKDIYLDLAFPFKFDKEKHIYLLSKFFESIFTNLLQNYYTTKTIKINGGKTIKESISKIIEQTGSEKRDKSKLLISTNTKHIKDNSNIIKHIYNELKFDFDHEIEISTNNLKSYILTYISQKHINTVGEIIKDIFDKTNKLNFGDSMIYKIIMLNSKKIQFTLDYLTTIFESVYITNTFATNIIKEEFFIVCKNKLRENYLNNIPSISPLYQSKNYSEFINIIYFNKIYRKKLIEIFKNIDRYFYLNGNLKQNYNKFDYYYQALINCDVYKLHLNRVL